MKIIISKSILIMTLFLSVCMYGQDNAERNALMAIYNATDGDNWAENENWGDVNIPVDEWYGVTVTNGHVTELYLDDNNLKDPIPQEIGDLNSLKVLHLSNNPITLLPESIGNLTDLEYLNLYDANLVSLPESMGNLESLVSLYLPFNELISLPESIGDLKNLTGLYLYENSLKSLPESIGGLESLLELYLNDNDLESLPVGIVNLDKLALLTLRNNFLPFSDLEPIYERFNGIEILTYSPQRNLGGVIERIVEAGENVILNSGIENSENTNFRWYKAVTVNGRTSFRVMEGETNNTYVIENMGNADQTWYICSATNTIITGFTL